MSEGYCVCCGEYDRFPVKGKRVCQSCIDEQQSDLN